MSRATDEILARKNNIMALYGLTSYKESSFVSAFAGGDLKA